jgi:hypothetical protein
MASTTKQKAMANIDNLSHTLPRAYDGIREFTSVSSPKRRILLRLSLSIKACTTKKTGTSNKSQRYCGYSNVMAFF